MISLEIHADPICPWCLIGKTRLDRALAARPGHPFAITWLPFQLNPDMPAEGMDRQAYLLAKFGSPEGILRAYGPIVETAAEEGLALDLPAIARTPCTRDAHRLIHWAGIEGRQTAVVDALFAGYFTQARDIGDRDVLADIADGAGLDAAVIRRLLATDADVDRIVAADSAARARGMTGVPTHVIAGRHVVPGAQPTELWLRLIDEITEQL